MHALAPTERPTLLVSRHAGAQRWLLAEAGRRGWANPLLLPHLELGTAPIRAAKRVAGTLPMPLIARLCADGVEVWQLDLPLDGSSRGVELSFEAMIARGARLGRVRVEYVEEVE